MTAASRRSRRATRPPVPTGRSTSSPAAVRDDLAVRPPSGDATPALDDETLARSVAVHLGTAFPHARVEEQWAFGRELDADGWELNVDADEGRITLSGTVGAPGDIRRAVESAQDVRGVTSSLTLEGSPYPYGARIHPYAAHGVYDVGPAVPYYRRPAYHGVADLPSLPEVSHRNATRAVARLRPSEGNRAAGTVRFRQTGEGVRVESNLRGLPPGGHAYHVHLFGDCTAADATSAGMHFDFAGSSRNPPDDIDRITGNLGTLEAESDGRASHEATVELASLTGPYSVVGHAVVVHEKANDPDSPPIGAAGPRLACGVIGFDDA